MSSLPLKVWDGTQWVNIGVQGGTVLYQNEAPASPQTGMIWIDADSETSVLNDEDYLTLSTASATYLTQSTASATYAPSASPTFTGEVNLPATTNYDGSLLSDTFASKLDLAGGKILQIVRNSDATLRSTTSTSPVDVPGMSITITPQRSDSLIIIDASFFGRCNSTTDEVRSSYQITDSSNNVLVYSWLGTFNLTGAGNRESGGPVFMRAITTPGTTSPVTYKMRFFVFSAGPTAFVDNNTTTGRMFATEVSA